MREREGLCASEKERVSECVYEREGVSVKERES